MCTLCREPNNSLNKNCVTKHHPSYMPYYIYCITQCRTKTHLSLPDDLTAAVALLIISRRLTEREPKAFVITLIDSSPELLLLLLPSGG